MGGFQRTPEGSRATKDPTGDDGSNERTGIENASTYASDEVPSMRSGSDRLEQLLSHPLRRRVLEHLEVNGPAVVEELAETLAETETAVHDRRQLSPRDELLVSLRSSHLPQLSNAALIERHGRTVELTAAGRTYAETLHGSST